MSVHYGVHYGLTTAQSSEDSGHKKKKNLMFPGCCNFRLLLASSLHIPRPNALGLSLRHVDFQIPGPARLRYTNGNDTRVGGQQFMAQSKVGQPVSRRLGDLLVNEGLITQENLQRALAEQKGSNEKLGSILVRLGLIQEDQLIGFPSRPYGIPALTPSPLDTNPR